MPTRAMSSSIMEQAVAHYPPALASEPQALSRATLSLLFCVLRWKLDQLRGGQGLPRSALCASAVAVVRVRNTCLAAALSQLGSLA